MSHSSMSVHSLIDRFSKGESPDSGEKGEQSRPSRMMSTQEMMQKQKQLEESGLIGLLGDDVKSFPLSEEAYIEVVKLRAEQERTKRDYYKLEISNRNLEIIQAAVKAHVPSNMIPLMCVGGSAEVPESAAKSIGADAKAKAKGGDSGAAQQEVSPPQSSFKKTHSRTSSKRDAPSQDSLNASMVPPLNYRFGGGPSTFPKRPLSPAKIGAAAVANLSVPTPPYRGSVSGFRNVLPQHQRHYSMPVGSASTQVPPQYPSIDLSKIESSSQSPSRQTAATTPSSSRSHNSPSLGSNVVGGSPTTTLQVKASPAQPLHKQKRSSHQPSQDSMTSFQHIIQFYHWKPEEPGNSPSGGSTNSFRPHSHKRHKSSTDNMSIDMGNITTEAQDQKEKAQGTDFPPVQESNVNENEGNEDEDEDDNDNDMSMDSNMTEMNSSKIVPVPSGDPSETGPSQTQNVGRYPHDILSPSNT